MPSQVWGRDPQEAYENPYEYAIQAQFAREARALLKQSYLLLVADRHTYTGAERTPQKAVWMLHMDALDALQDAQDALARKRHRVAGKLFRNVMESLDLAAYFHDGNTRSAEDLAIWYADGWVPHGHYRDHIHRTEGSAAAAHKNAQYKNLSKFVHRSYRAILDGYSSGVGDRLVHDGRGQKFGDEEWADTMLVFPQVISSYYAALAELILASFLPEIVRLGTASKTDVLSALDLSLEKETVKRRFMPRQWLNEILDIETDQSREGEESG